MTYKEELTKVMEWLGCQSNTVFVGQGVRYPGHGMFSTLVNVPMEKRIELPVMENAQLGMSVGLALTGKVVISIFPRFDFLLCAMDSLVNSLDKLEEFTHGQFHAKVIIRVGIGATTPLYPGIQHCGDYTEMFRACLNNINIVKLIEAKDIVPAYKAALDSPKSCLMVEYGEKF